MKRTKKQDAGLVMAIEKAGGQRKLAKAIGMPNHQSIFNWVRIPPHHILKIEAALDIPREKLRPDLYKPRSARTVSRTVSA